MLVNRGQILTIYPNDFIKQVFSQSFGNRRFIYNHLVNISNQSQIRKFIDGENSYSLKNKKGLQKLTKYLNDEFDFLKFSHSQSNQESAHRVAQNWDEFFKNGKGKPKFKKKHQQQTFYIPNQNNIEIRGQYLYIKPLKMLMKKKFGFMPKDGEILIPFKQKSRIQGEITGVTIKKENNMYTASISYKFENNIEKREYLNLSILRKIGIDIGFKNKTVDNSGLKSDNKFRKHQEKAEKTKRILQRKKSKSMERKKDEIIKKRDIKTINKKEFNRIKGVRKKDKYAHKITEDKLTYSVISKENSFSSAEWQTINKAGKKHDKHINILSRKIANITKNDNHHISKFYAENFDFVAMETLNISAMQKIWGRTIGKLALSELINMIKYKTESQGGIFVQIDRWFASTKICSDCGFKYSFGLDVREWTCPSCSSNHDRDVNASINILTEGIRQYISNLDWNRTSPSNRFERPNLFLHCA